MNTSQSEGPPHTLADTFKGALSEFAKELGKQTTTALFQAWDEPSGRTLLLLHMILKNRSKHGRPVIPATSVFLLRIWVNELVPFSLSKMENSC